MLVGKDASVSLPTSSSTLEGFSSVLPWKLRAPMGLHGMVSSSQILPPLLSYDAGVRMMGIWDRHRRESEERTHQSPVGVAARDPTCSGDMVLLQWLWAVVLSVAGH